MRIAYFGTGGEITLEPLRRLAQKHTIVAVVRPQQQRSTVRRGFARLARSLGVRTHDPVTLFARENALLTLSARSGDDQRMREQLLRLRPDLICIATFRWLLSPDMITVAPAGAINLHPSLLPRHRGPIPLFWIYHRDDRESGVTVHKVDRRADHGAILDQEAFALARGCPVEELYANNVKVGAKLLARTVDAIERGHTTAREQDHRLATKAPHVRRGTAMVDFESWPTERVWHFLRGLYPRFVEPLTDCDGNRVTYGGVLGYEPGPTAESPGQVTRNSGGSLLHCLDGTVQLARSDPGSNR